MPSHSLLCWPMVQSDSHTSIAKQLKLEAANKDCMHAQEVKIILLEGGPVDQTRMRLLHKRG